MSSSTSSPGGPGSWSSLRERPIAGEPRVLITGAGLHGALGGARETWKALASGRSALAMRPLPGVTGFPDIPAAPASEASPADYLEDLKQLKYMSPAARMGVLAAGRALEDADLLESVHHREEMALFAATGLIAFDLSAVGEAIDMARGAEGSLDMVRLGSEGLRLCHPLLPFRMLLNMPLGMISIAFGIRGENAILYPGPDQAVVCLDMALRGIRAGRFLRALVGGITHGVSLLPVCTLRRLGRLASSLEAAQPYRPRHAGYAPADAAGFLVVESERSAAERGARPLAVLETAVTHQPIDSGSGARVRSLAASWRESADGVPPDLLVSTGTLDYEEDRDVLRALESAWPACSPPITSFDGLLGYQGAASVPSLVALSTQMLAGGDAAVPLLAGSEERSRTGFAAGDSPSLSPARIVISASHPDGAHCVVRLRRAGGPG